MLWVPFVESLHTLELSGMGDLPHSVQGGREQPVHSSFWPMVGHFTFLGDLREMGTSDSRTLKTSVNW